ncbi:MAG: ribonuclease HII, partial [Alphaproteobacteria bacterium]
MASPHKTPEASFALEDGFEGLVCGIDEVGRGPLAGPIVAACVIIPKKMRTLDFVTHIKDSKKLNLKKRLMLYQAITSHLPYAISELSPADIDKHNILQASLLAMTKAHNTILKKQNIKLTHALIDGNKLPVISTPASAIIKGDSKSKTIAAASIIAKVHRDKIMDALSCEFPEYGWERN